MGAILLITWIDDPRSPTGNLALLGFGYADPDAMQATFADIIALVVDDGVLFNSDTLRVDSIREAVEYGGVRLRAIADVGSARLPVAIGVGSGDALEPGAEILDYPPPLSRSADCRGGLPWSSSRTRSHSSFNTACAAAVTGATSACRLS